MGCALTCKDGGKTHSGFSSENVARENLLTSPVVDSQPSSLNLLFRIVALLAPLDIDNHIY